MIRQLIDHDVDQMVEDIGFEIDWMPWVGRGLVVCHHRIKSVLLFGTTHHIVLFKILDNRYKAQTKELFEQMYKKNKHNTYYLKVNEYDVNEQLLLKELGYTCYKLEKDGSMRFVYHKYERVS